MVVVPAESPFTTPNAFTVPAAGFEELHTPPDVASVKFSVAPTHTVPDAADNVPAFGAGLTVTTVVARQPAPDTAYVIVALPPATPLTVPSEPTVAMPALLLLHVPPAVASVSASVDPAHTGAFPVIAEGCAFTVTTAVVKQPVLIEYVIVAVPGDTADATAPEYDTVATDVLLLVHDTPPPVASDRKVDEPTHTVSVPSIADGAGLMVMSLVTKQPAPEV